MLTQTGRFFGKEKRIQFECYRWEQKGLRRGARESLARHFCAFNDRRGRILTPVSLGSIDTSTGDCVSIQIDKYERYVAEVVTGLVRVCGANENGERLACTAWENIDSLKEATETPSRSSFARLGFKIGAWSGGMDARTAAKAERGQVNVPIQAYIGEDFAAGFYNALQRQGDADRIALILLPIHTSWWNSPSHNELREGRIQDLVNRGLSIGNSELESWDRSRLRKIEEGKEQIRQAERSAREAAAELERLRRRAKDDLDRLFDDEETAVNEVRKGAERVGQEIDKSAQKLGTNPEDAVRDFGTQILCGFC